jgi:hypothetical protein
MALFGNKDSKSATGTIAIGTNGAVTGSSTLFTTEAKIGNTIRADGRDYVITKITSNTAATVESGINGGAITAVTAGASYTLSEKPVSVAQAESAGSPSGVHGDSNKVFGVSDNAGENYAAAGSVVQVGVANAGTRYLEVPAVTFSGGGGSSAAATASIAGGVVTSIALTNNGFSYENVPTVAVAKPIRTIPTSGVTISTEQIAYTTHGLTAAEAVVYNNGGSTSITGLTSGTTYYVSALGLAAGTFRLAASASAAAGRTALAGVAISGTGGQFTCTATTLAVGDHIRITGTLGGTGTITGYTTGKIYEVSAVTGTSPSVTGFTVTEEDGTAVVSTAGTPTGLTYTPYTIVMISGTGNNAQYFEIQAAADQATAVAALGGGTEGGESVSNITHTGWIRRTTGTGGRAGRVHYETLVAMGSMTGDQADDRQFPDD